MKHELDGVRDGGTSNTSCRPHHAGPKFNQCVNTLGRESRSLSNCQVASVGLQGSSASGLPALGRLVRPRHEVPSLDRGFAVTSAMPFLKPDVQGCGYSRLSGMQYLSTSCVAHGHHSGRESELYLKAPILQFHACWGGGAPWFCLPAKRADKLRWRSLRGSVQGCAFVCVVLLARRCKHHSLSCRDRNSVGALC